MVVLSAEAHDKKAEITSIAADIDIVAMACPVQLYLHDMYIPRQTSLVYAVGYHGVLVLPPPLSRESSPVP